MGARTDVLTHECFLMLVTCLNPNTGQASGFHFN